MLVVGGGPAGTFAAIAAKQFDPGAEIVLLSDEACEPYEKPPLSKAVLLGTAQPLDACIAGPNGLAGHGVTLRHARVTTIDRAARVAVLESGERLGYSALVLATGSLVRELPQLPAGMPYVHYLRSEADARALLATLRRSRSLLVVGGGLIGLEVAASAAGLGLRTTVLEVAPRVLARVCHEPIAAIVEAAHRDRGVDLRLSTGVGSVSAGGAGGLLVTPTAGEPIAADVIVVGTGATPDVDLARAIGLAVDDGIVVDAGCRTSDPAIYAAGDVARFPGPHGAVRLENWRHAQDQGMIAGRNAAGDNAAYASIPSFWSEQYDLYIQGVGWPRAGTVPVSRPLPGRAALMFDVIDGRIAAAQGINAQRDLAAVRRLIERRIPIDASALADPSQPIAAMLKR